MLSKTLSIPFAPSWRPRSFPLVPTSVAALHPCHCSLPYPYHAVVRLSILERIPLHASTLCLHTICHLRLHLRIVPPGTSPRSHARPGHVSLYSCHTIGTLEPAVTPSSPRTPFALLSSSPLLSSALLRSSLDLTSVSIHTFEFVPFIASCLRPDPDGVLTST
ncbi:hypothetical protein K466DRAFT_382870 [Polyporus arcularius HHB13444]|uniref:Uncharacterized protein n=1 Tax=Polyporus arcularius HHB13444 TaxID=1314778 RepID=A0A5C3PL69_9APHY|nr:hypothetical protein K466DRAFT_382870 [Polyporus arcularius HHB13444]